MEQSYTEKLIAFYKLKEQGWDGIYTDSPAAFLISYEVSKIIESFQDSTWNNVKSVKAAYDNVTLADVVSWTSSCLDACCVSSAFIAVCLVKVYMHKWGLSNAEVAQRLTAACDEFCDLFEDDLVEGFVRAFGFREDPGFMREFGNRLNDNDWLLELQSFWDTSLYLYVNSSTTSIDDLSNNVVIDAQLWSICQAKSNSTLDLLRELNVCIDFVNEFPQYSELLSLDSLAQAFHVCKSLDEIISRLQKPGAFNRVNFVLQMNPVFKEEIALMWLKLNLINEGLITVADGGLGNMLLPEIDEQLITLPLNALESMKISLPQRALKFFDNSVPLAMSKFAGGAGSAGTPGAHSVHAFV